MSNWKDNIVTDFVVTTGDGKVYTPISSYLSWNKDVTYNTAEFVFKNVAGSLVKRGTPRGTVYNLEINFQGLDNLDMMREFDKSAANPRPWRITHPFYGSLYVQPTTLKYDNSGLNVTRICGPVVQTILDSGLTVKNNVTDAVAQKVDMVNTIYATKTAGDVPVMRADFLARLARNIDNTYAATLLAMNTVQSYVDQYTAYYYRASSIINSIVHDTLTTISAAQQMICYPAYFTNKVLSRIRMFEAAIQIAENDIAYIGTVYGRATSALKRQYENVVGANIAGMCLTTVNNITDDYDNRSGILAIIGELVNAYNTFVENLGGLMTENGSMADAYLPDADAILMLRDLVDYTTSYLFALSAKAKQERIYVVPYDTNLLMLADMFYTEDDNDTAANLIISSNNIGLNELLFIPKGREIIYYV